MESIYKKDIGRDAARVELAIKNVMKDSFPEIHYENLADEIMIDVDLTEVPALKSILRQEYMYL